MQLINGRWIFSASDLTLLSDCEHAIELTMAYRADLLDLEPAPAEGMVALAGIHGLRHEHEVLERLRGERQVIEIEQPSQDSGIEGLEAAADRTYQAMRSGAEVIYQGCFFDGDFLGYSDFLIRAEHGYEVYDTKLSRHVEESALVQLASYSDQVARLGFPMPAVMHVWLGDDRISSHLVEDHLESYRLLRTQLEERLGRFAEVPDPYWADKRGSCGVCRWREVCGAGREEARDLSLIHGIRRSQVLTLRSSKINTLEELVNTDSARRPDKMSLNVFEKLRGQARLQALQDAGRSAADSVGPVFADFFDRAGVSRMPARSEGDVWFDIEGDPFASQGNGLEYLFGFLTREVSDEGDFVDLWAHDSAQEKVMLQQFVDLMDERIARWPELHIYHYANYERTKLVKLAQRYGTRETQVQRWMEEGRLVDLEKIFRGSFRVSQRSYSLKKLEPLYGLVREEDVQTAGDSVVDYEEYLELLAKAKTDPGKAQELLSEAQAKLDGIRDYNEVDCRSTYLLDTWIRQRIEEQELS